MKRISILVLIAFFLIIGACNKNENSIEQAMSKARVGYDSIIHVENLSIDNLSIVFYMHGESLGLGELENTKNNNWVWRGGTTNQVTKNPISWNYNNLEGKIPIIFGTINQSQIESVIVETKEGKSNAEMRQNSGSRIWYIILKNPQNPPIKILAYDENKNLVYSTET